MLITKINLRKEKKMKEFLNKALNYFTNGIFDENAEPETNTEPSSYEEAPKHEPKREPKKERFSATAKRERERVRKSEEKENRYSDSSSYSSYNSYSSFGSSSSKTSNDYDASRNKSRVVNMTQNTIITSIKDYSECEKIVKQLREKKTVIINVDHIDKVTGAKVVHFLSGAVTALDGDIKKISNSIVVVAPNTVKLTGLNGETIPSNIAEAFVGND